MSAALTARTTARTARQTTQHIIVNTIAEPRYEIRFVFGRSESLVVDKAEGIIMLRSTGDRTITAENFQEQFELHLEALKNEGLAQDGDIACVIYT